MIVLKVDMVVKPGTEEECKNMIRVLQDKSRQEPGCVQYVGHQSTENPRKFLFYEVYRDESALQMHRDAPYFREYVHAGLDRIVESRTRELFKAVD